MFEASFSLSITSSPSNSEAIAISHCHCIIDCHHSQPPLIISAVIHYFPHWLQRIPSHSEAIAIGHAEALEVEVVQLGEAVIVKKIIIMQFDNFLRHQCYDCHRLLMHIHQIPRLLLSCFLSRSSLSLSSRCKMRSRKTFCRNLSLFHLHSYEKRGARIVESWYIKYIWMDDELMSKKLLEPARLPCFGETQASKAQTGGGEGGKFGLPCTLRHNNNQEGDTIWPSNWLFDKVYFFFQFQLKDWMKRL